MVVKGTYEYVTLFAPNCIFRAPSVGEFFPEVSLPLSRFLKGFNEVNISFAFKHDDSDTLITLRNNVKIVCKWMGQLLYKGDEAFCVLKSRRNGEELWFSGIFQRGNDLNNTYVMQYSITSVMSISVDWNQDGCAPEDPICFQIISC
uniref:DUF5727 domain-containing protein n=1 Tax=Schistocephalus solidus TaxID=70667 RepID=A0A0X3PKK2_SCHSO